MGVSSHDNPASIQLDLSTDNTKVTIYIVPLRSSMSNTILLSLTYCSDLICCKVSVYTCHILIEDNKVVVFNFSSIQLTFSQ